MVLLTDEELLETLERQLPTLLKQHPELEQRAYTAFIEAFATKKEVAAVLAELHAFRGEFGQFRLEVNERFEKVDEQFADLKHWVELNVGGFQRRAGRKLEDVVAGTLRLALGRTDVAAENLRLRQRLADEEGVIGLVGRHYEVDILVDNSALIVFEVKSVCEAEDVERFGDKVALVRWHYPQKTVDGVIVSLAPDDEVKALCAQQGIELVS